MERQPNQRQVALGALSTFFENLHLQRRHRNLRRHILWARFCDFFGDNATLALVSIEEEFAQLYADTQDKRISEARSRRRSTPKKKNYYYNRMRA